MLGRQTVSCRRRDLSQGDHFEPVAWHYVLIVVLLPGGVVTVVSARYVAQLESPLALVSGSGLHRTATV